MHSFLDPTLDSPLSFVEYLEKIYLIDCLTGNFINDYFVRFESFPFLGEDTVQSEMYQSYTFIIWNHFRSQYLGRLNRGDTNLDGIDGVNF